VKEKVHVFAEVVLSMNVQLWPKFEVSEEDRSCWIALQQMVQEKSNIIKKWEFSYPQRVREAEIAREEAIKAKRKATLAMRPKSSSVSRELRNLQS